MKKITMRVTALLLAAAMLAFCLSACADTGNPEDTSAAGGGTLEEETAEDPFKTLDNPNVTFDNFEFNVLSADYKEYYTPLDVESLNSEIVNDAIYTRNRTIEDQYKIKFYNDLDHYDNLLTDMEKQVNAGGDGDYELIMLICRNAYTATIKNYLIDYDNLPYVDVNKEYYFRDLNKQFTIGGKMFFAYGAESINVLSFANCILFNKNMAVEHGMPDFYDMVKNNTWTFAEMFKYAEEAAVDTDGDGKLKLNTDVLGLVGDYDKINPAAWIAADEYLITKDADDMPAFTCTESERFIDVMQYVLENYSRDFVSAFTAGDGKNTAFMEDKAFMWAHQVGTLISIRSMSSDYGVLPWPKYDLQQDHYVSRAEDAWLHCVPTTCGNTERTSVILQALAYYSYRTVYDAYYEQALSAQYVRDPQSVEMLKQIVATMTVDIGDNVWYQDIRLPLVAAFCSQKGGTKLASTLKKYSRTAERLIKTAAEFAAKN
ncbi:MAG: hypothetical protein MJ192_11110 [Clostridia bacterium]|nr:hypothetical protein [Clostridia bacterium]